MVSVAFIVHDADAFRRAYPGWPHAAPAPQGGTMTTTPKPAAPCGHPLTSLDELGECHGTDPATGEPCWGIFDELAKES